MIHVIENEQIKVAITDTGAEIQSIILKSDGTEYLWQGDPKYWAGRAYNLFPICGRLNDGKYTYMGKTYEMKLHGFLRDSMTTVTEKSDHKITFTLTENEQILAQYPFLFRIDITYSIENTAIKTFFKVTNNDKKTMYFGIGGHPGFNVPLTKDETFDDYYLEFDCVKPLEHIKMSERGLLLGRTEPYEIEDGKIIRLHHKMFDSDALFFTKMCQAINLKSTKCKKEVRLEYKGMQNLGLWHAPRSEAPYICIEPWCSLPASDFQVDDLSTKYQMTALESGKEYQNEFIIIIK